MFVWQFLSGTKIDGSYTCIAFNAGICNILGIVNDASICNILGIVGMRISVILLVVFIM